MKYVIITHYDVHNHGAVLQLNALIKVLRHYNNIHNYKKAVILAACLGSRLRPITNEVPNCMVPFNGIRIIDKQIDNLLKAGVTEI